MMNDKITYFIRQSKKDESLQFYATLTIILKRHYDIIITRVSLNHLIIEDRARPEFLSRMAAPVWLSNTIAIAYHYCSSFQNYKYRLHLLDLNFY